MTWLKNNIADIIALVGVSLISMGVFIWSTPLGLVVTGLMLGGVAYLMKGGD